MSYSRTASWKLTTLHNMGSGLQREDLERLNARMDMRIMSLSTELNKYEQNEDVSFG